MHQIEREEVRRKALLADANQDDDDFTWEDEEDGEDSDEYMTRSQADVSTVTPVNTSSTTVNTNSNPSVGNAMSATTPVAKAPNSTSQTPVNVSPRESEDSYDVVSSGNVSSTGGKSGERRLKEGEKGGENGDDSDWE